MSNITYLGDFQNTISVYLIGDNAIIDPGPYSVTNDVLDAIKAKGFKVEDIEYIILTHLHMDHSGNAWALLEYMPNAKVMIDAKAVKYLLDPTPLIESSRNVLGTIIDRWGIMKPIAENRIIGVNDNYTLQLNDDTLRFIATPGHAPFHLSILKDDELFTGDAIGIKVNGKLRPASPLPSFRLDLALQSINKIKEMNVRRLYMPHFGIANDVNATIEENIMIYEGWARIIQESINNNLDDEKILELINERFKYDDILKDEFIKSLFLSDLRGFIKYFKHKK